MGTSIISQQFFSKAACSLYGKEERILKEKLTVEKGDHSPSCWEGSWQVRGCPRAKAESLALQQYPWWLLEKLFWFGSHSARRSSGSLGLEGGGCCLFSVWLHCLQVQYCEYLILQQIWNVKLCVSPISVEWLWKIIFLNISLIYF